MRRGVLPGAAALLLAGCTTAGPNYTLPDPAVVNRPSAQGAFDSGKEKRFADVPLPDHWWQLYGDTRLDGFVAEGLAANADLRVADANLRRADAVVAEVAAGRTLSTALGGGASLSRPAGTGGSLPGTVGYDVGLSLAYPLDLAGRIRRAIEAAQGDAEAVAAARDNVRVTVAAEIARSYAAACTANMVLAANNRVLALQRQTLGVTQRLQRGGRGTAFDVTRAQSAVDQSAALVPSTIATRTAALYRLATLMGRAPADYPKDVASCATAPTMRKPLPIGDGAGLIARRPDIRAAERSLAAATARIGVATANLYPQVSLGGSVGLTGPLSAFGSGDAFHVGLGPLISWSFPNRPIVRAQIAQAGAAADAALAQFDSTTLEALRQTETALSAYAREADRNAALARAQASAARAANQAGTLYRFGRTDFLALLSAQAALTTAQANLAASNALLVDRQVDVFKALGGGWQF
ncbi:efflux transporter outer membrane subunit [Sphingomonas sp. 10B4]|uniref:efflux transporter outer membrane subunit n=1 Tax=Sphingomonas sp. 10B4 TaxID=3048575 RepID=UPI002AB3B02D|nr:efflux transporter outer membrane subunit [Sphingomonas sp. 10B4]MDY7525732.1 efflux transporter outer membrane subunit [Sphingomonas sp. 10B4]MEB0281888.1 efflux transporter outer membrane subunit [Sphingomonas sp. 10B4]